MNEKQVGCACERSQIDARGFCMKCGQAILSQDDAETLLEIGQRIREEI